ncbi:MAG TPA: DsrE family protein [Chitinophagaceae bacterium]|nr:DsrE family protein [Chitinophagaceae bacterium]
MKQVKNRTALVIGHTLGMLIVLLFLGNHFAIAQTTPGAQAAVQSAASFTGAKATKRHYDAVYQLNTDDPKIIGATLRNISNALGDPRLKGKLTVELVAFSGGWEVFNKDNQYGEKLLELKRKGVILSQCHNTLVERHIQTSQLLPYVSIVPSGNGELIIRQAQGWSIVKP